MAKTKKLEARHEDLAQLLADVERETAWRMRTLARTWSVDLVVHELGPCGVRS